MRIIGHGMDILDDARVVDCFHTPEGGWDGKVFSADERAQSDEPHREAEYFAGRFAGEEAVAKALGTGFTGKLTWRCIEILRTASRAPGVRLTGEALARAESLGVTCWLITISHNSGVSVASVIAVSE